MLKLGTNLHHDMLLKGIDSLEAVGCFGLTELGFGESACSWLLLTSMHQGRCSITRMSQMLSIFAL